MASLENINIQVTLSSWITNVYVYMYVYNIYTYVSVIKRKDIENKGIMGNYVTII